MRKKDRTFLRLERFSDSIPRRDSGNEWEESAHTELSNKRYLRGGGKKGRKRGAPSSRRAGDGEKPHLLGISRMWQTR